MEDGAQPPAWNNIFNAEHFPAILISLILTHVLNQYYSPEVQRTPVKMFISIQNTSVPKILRLPAPMPTSLSKFCMSTLTFFLPNRLHLSTTRWERRRETPDRGGNAEAPSRRTPDPDDLIETGCWNAVWVQKGISSGAETWETGSADTGRDAAPRVLALKDTPESLVWITSTISKQRNTWLSGAEGHRLTQATLQYQFWEGFLWESFVWL